MDAYASELREIAERMNKIIKCVDADRNPEWVDERRFSDMVERLVMSIYMRIHTTETMIIYFKFEFEQFYRSALLHGIDLKMKFDEQVKNHGGTCVFEKFEEEKIYERFCNGVKDHMKDLRGYPSKPSPYTADTCSSPPRRCTRGGIGGRSLLG